jgi:septal ring factor EnvC (AmiA/AmiB activator)
MSTTAEVRVLLDVALIKNQGKASFKGLQELEVTAKDREKVIPFTCLGLEIDAIESDKISNALNETIPKRNAEYRVITEASQGIEKREHQIMIENQLANQKKQLDGVTTTFENLATTAQALTEARISNMVELTTQPETPETRERTAAVIKELQTETTQLTENYKDAETKLAAFPDKVQTLYASTRAGLTEGEQAEMHQKFTHG